MGISLYRNGVKVQKKRVADSTTARLINYVLYLMPTEWLVEQKMAGSLPASRQTYNYHPFYISMLYLFFSLFATSGPEHQQLV